MGEKNLKWWHYFIIGLFSLGVIEILLRAIGLPSMLKGIVYFLQNTYFLVFILLLLLFSPISLI